MIRLMGCTVAVVYLLAIIDVHARVISPEFAYLGYTYSPVPAGWLAVAAALTVAAAAALPPRMRRPSDLASASILLLVVVPSIAMSFAMGRLEHADAARFGALIVLGHLVLTVVLRAGRSSGDGRSARKRGRGHFDRPILVLPRASETGMFAGMVVVLVAGHAYLALTVGFSLELVALTDVYDVREEFSSHPSRTALGSYLVPWLGNAIGPVLAVLAACRRRWGLLGLAVVGQLALYAQTGLKTLLFSLPALALVALLLHRTRRTHHLVLAALVGTVTVVLVDLLIGDGLLTSLFVRRFVATPGALSAVYYEFFSARPHTYLSHSVLEGVVPYPYSRPVPVEVGAYWTSSAPSANANFLADGYANAGVPGLLVSALLAGMLLRLYDDLSEGLPFVPASLLLVMPLVTLSNSALLTSLLTHGLGLVMLLAGVLPREGWRRAGAPSTAPRKQEHLT